MSSLIIESQQIDNLTNQITYNRLLRNTSKILKEYVFEFNDTYTRQAIMQKLRALYNKASERALQDYSITMKDFDESNPHYIEVDIIIQFRNMINHVKINISNYYDL